MKSAAEYWKANLRLVIISLIVWFVVSFGFGILLVDPLNGISAGRLQARLLVRPAGIHLCLCGADLLLCRRMNKLDRNSTFTKIDQLNRRKYNGSQTMTFLVVGATFAIYIYIAIKSRAYHTSEFYVAGKGVHPVLNGMATGADWMSRRLLHLHGRPDRLQGL